MSCATKIITVCPVNCDVQPYNGRSSPINPLTAFCHLHNIDMIDACNKVRDEGVLFDEAVKAAELMFDGCVLIRNDFLDAVAKKDFDTAYMLFTRQLAVKKKQIPFTVRAVIGLEAPALACKFFETVADELEYIIEHRVCEDAGWYDEDDYPIGLTD